MTAWRSKIRSVFGRRRAREMALHQSIESLKAGFERQNAALGTELETAQKKLDDLYSHLENQKILMDDVKGRLETQDHVLRSFEHFFLLKEIDPGLIRIVAELPEFDSSTLDDLYNRFSWYTPCIKSIRHWAADLVSSIVFSSNTLEADAMRSLAKGNLTRAGNTDRYLQSVVEYIEFLSASFTDSLPAETVLAECRRLLHEDDDLKPEARLAWFHYCSLLLEAGEKEEAGRLVEKWRKCCGAEYFWQFLPLAHLAWDLGIRDDDIQKAALIWDSYQAPGRDKPKFDELIQGRSVAVVGNGPQETGSERGEEIDAHDVVIRFNRYRINQKTTADYGRRTTICFTNPDYFTPPDNAAELEAFFFIKNFRRSPLPDRASLERMFDYVQAGKIWFHFQDIVDAFTPLHRRITRECGVTINRPTSGYIMAVSLRSLRPEFGLKNLYGFSCKSERPFTLEGGYHYDPDDPEETITLFKAMNLRHSLHSFEMERRALRWLFSGEKPPQT